MGATLLLFLLAIIIPIGAQMKVRSSYSHYSKVYSESNMTGAQVARYILDQNGLYNIPVEESQGYLSDHYDPRSKVVRLSSANYHNASIAGIAVAAHEVGHAIQDATDYSFLRFRHQLVPLAQISSNAAWIFIMIGLFTQMTGIGLVGAALMLGGLLFQIVTLPVEFDASNRAMKQLSQLGLLGSQEVKGARSVLNAAALTYVAAVAVGILELLRILLIFGGNRDD
ncbi:MAG: zinc metallopeptidase [Bacillaceae bacterium]